MEYELDILANGRHPPRLKNNLNEIKADFNKHSRQPDQQNNQPAPRAEPQECPNAEVHRFKAPGHWNTLLIHIVFGPVYSHMQCRLCNGRYMITLMRVTSKLVAWGVMLLTCSDQCAGVIVLQLLTCLNVSCLCLVQTPKHLI